MGGPDGGDGGKGGDVWLVADRNTASLIAFRDHPHRRAESGTHGSGRKRHGHSGPDLEIKVPIGTQISDQAGTVLADLPHEGDRWLAAEGGRGGHGNARFLSNSRRAPAFAEQGEHGQEQWLVLDLKLMADVALVGFPNAGKSTLISRMSAAKPKIANYPFTTLVPNLGVVRTDDGFEMVVADIPGLIEGAAEGRGLGHQFLRHIERARVLVMMVDLAEYAEPDPLSQARILLRELGDYSEELLERPRVVVGSRCDMASPENRELLSEVVALVGSPPTDDDASWGNPEWQRPLAVSAVTGEGVPELIGAMRARVGESRDRVEPEPGFVTLRPVPEGVEVVRTDDGGFEVLGREARRAVGLSDLTNVEALDEVRRRLDRLGVDAALARAGATDGDSVVIGDFVFEFTVDEGIETEQRRPTRRERRAK